MNMPAWDPSREPHRVAERVRAAVVRAALDAYEDAAIRGLCGDGAWEVAVAAMRSLDLRQAALGAPRPEP
jgi:hypothetical protein